MTRAEFKEQIRIHLESMGFKKPIITTALFGKRADIVARDKKDKKRFLKAEVVYKKGKEYIRVFDPNSIDWIDEIEAFDAFMD